MSIFENTNQFLPVANIRTLTNQDIKEKMMWLPPGCQWTTEQLTLEILLDSELYANFFLSCSLCLPPFALLSFHLSKQLFLHKLQSYSQQHVQ